MSAPTKKSHRRKSPISMQIHDIKSKQHNKKIPSANTRPLIPHIRSNAPNSTRKSSRLHRVPTFAQPVTANHQFDTTTPPHLSAHTPHHPSPACDFHRAPTPLSCLPPIHSPPFTSHPPARLPTSPTQVKVCYKSNPIPPFRHPQPPYKHLQHPQCRTAQHRDPRPTHPLHSSVATYRAPQHHPFSTAIAAPPPPPPPAHRSYHNRPQLRHSPFVPPFSIVLSPLSRPLQTIFTVPILSIVHILRC